MSDSGRGAWMAFIEKNGHCEVTTVQSENICTSGAERNLEEVPLQKLEGDVAGAVTGAVAGTSLVGWL